MFQNRTQNDIEFNEIIHNYTDNNLYEKIDKEFRRSLAYVAQIENDTITAK